ncbi:MAG: PDZ domain-containing protein, partial [Rhodobacteraceae bacterium]|nr:PDZ domain-containing protein [Paracoccaceae bacterium]
SGIVAGDVITQFDGKPVADTRDLTRRVADSPVGQAVPVIVLREGKTETLQVTLGRREDAEAAELVPATADKPEEPQQADILGMTVTPITDELKQSMNLPADAEGLVVSKVDVSSEAYAKGLRDGDIITEAGQQKVARVKDLESRIAEAKDAGRKSILLLVRRAGDPRFVALAIE